MSLIQVRHACGHEASHAGPDERRVLLAKVPCPECTRQARAARDTARSATRDLPPLEGNAHEIAWAEPIRRKVIEANQRYCAQLRAEEPYAEIPAVRAALETAAEAALSTLQQESQAAWWIEHHLDALDFAKRRIVTAIAPLLRDDS